ncbi:MAG: hypothetical protein ACOCU8_01960 [Patescibacteria group bacterium]
MNALNFKPFQNFYNNQDADSKEQMRQFLKDKFESIAPGKFETVLPGVDAISFVRPMVGVGEPDDQIHLVLFRTDQEGKTFNDTLTLTNEGSIIGKIPKNLSFDKVQLREEVRSILESLDVDFWLEVNQDILPSKKNPEKGSVYPSDPKERENIEKAIDSRRIEFLRNKSLFGFYNGMEGFKGYFGFVFPKGIVLENKEIGNAVFIIRFPVGRILDFPELVYDLPPSRRVKPKDRERIYEDFVAGLLIVKDGDAASKTELVKILGAERSYNPRTGKEDKEWQDQMSDKIKDLF